MSNTNNTNPSQNEKTSLTENADGHESWWKGLFKRRTDILLLGGGLLFLLINLVVFFGIDIKPSAWLFYLDTRYWSVYSSIILWATALWLISASTDVMEDYRPLIRMLAITSFFLVMILMLNPFNVESLSPRGFSFWFSVIAAFSIVRSLFLLYEYRYGEDEIDLEEAQWFWGVSGFLFVSLVVLGFMCTISVEIPSGDSFYTKSYFETCNDGLRELIQQGTGSYALRGFAFLLIVSSVAFIYIIGRWILIVSLKIREG